MRTLLFTLLCGSLSLLNAQDIPVPTTQMPIITKNTATWCPKCGDYGWVLMNGIIEDNAGKAVIWAAHKSSSSDLYVKVAADIVNNFKLDFGQPTFYVNGEDQDVFSNNYQSKRQVIKDKVNAQAFQSPLAQTGLLMGLDNRTLDIRARTKFFKAANGTFHLGLYLVEKTHIGYQSSVGNSAQHKFVLRASLTPESSFGNLLLEGSLAANAEASTSLRYDLPEDIKTDNIQVVAVIWQKVDDKFVFVNSNLVEDYAELTTDIETPSVVFGAVRITPNPVTNAAQIQLLPSAPLQQVNLRLLDVAGRQVQNIFDGPLSEGVHHFELERSGLPAGTYWLQARSGVQVYTQMVIFQ